MNYQDKSKEELIAYIEKLQREYDILKTMREKELADFRSANESIAANEKKYRLLAEEMTDIIWEMDLNLSFVYISSGIEKLTGFLPSEVINKNLFEFIEPSMVGQLKDSIIQRRESYKQTGTLKSAIFEFKQICKNGEYIWVEALSNPKFNGNNQLIGFQGVTRNISEWKEANEALRLSEEKLSTVFHSAPYVITILRISDQKLIEVNKAVENLTGYTREELLNDSSISLVVWEDINQRNEYFEALKRHERLKQYNLRYKSKIGEIGHAILSTEYIKIENELCVLGFFEVVTDRKKAEEQLEENREKYRALSEAAFDSIFISEKGICVEQNLQAERMFGYTSTEAIGRYCTDWIAKEDREKVMNNMLSGYEEPYEVMALRKDGSIFPVLIRARMMHYKGKDVRVSSLSDISLRIKAENKLVESEKQFRLIFENSNDAIFWAEASTGILIKCNKAAEKLVGRNQNEIIGSHHSILHPIEKYSKHVEEFAKHVTQRVNLPVETEVITKDGEIRIVEVSSTVISIEGKDINQGIFKDVTDKKRMEEALRNVVIASAQSEGENIFSTLVSHLAKALQVKEVFVGQIVGNENEKIKTIAYYKNNKIIANSEYDIEGTPCAEVLQHGKRVFSNNVAKLFPLDSALKARNIESYMGMLLKDSKGERLGIMSVLHDQELLQTGEAESILSLFSYRAASELERKQAEDTLRDNRANLSALVENTSDSIWAIDNSYRLVIVNGQFKREFLALYGVELSPGMNMLDVMTDELRKVWKLKYDRALANERFVLEEHFVFGAIDIYVEIAMNPINADGKIIGVSVFAHDITKRKLAELAVQEKNIEIAAQNAEYVQLNEELSQTNIQLIKAKVQAEESETKFEAITNQASEGIALSDLKGNYVFVNPAFCKMTGYTTEELLKLTVFDIKAKTEPPGSFKKSVNELAGIPIQIKLQRKDGTEFYTEIIGRIIKINNLDFVLGTVRDITERKQAEMEVQEKNKEIEDRNKELLIAEQKLKHSEATYRGILDSITEAVYIQAFDGSFLEVNHSVEKMYGYDKEEFIGKTPEFLSAPVKNDSLDLVPTIQKAINGEPQTFEFWGIRKDGTIFPKEVNVTLGQYFEQDVIIAVAREISERKHAELILHEKNKEIASQNEEYLQLNEELLETNLQLIRAKEKAEESDKLKTSFLQNMSHEIRTPMNAIMGFSSLLVNEYNNIQKLEQYAGIINQRCSDLLEIINDILDIAKIESSQLDLHIEEYDLNLLFLELSAFFNEHQKRIGKDKIIFNLNALPNIKDNLILTDGVKLKQILINLIGNAFKFTASGKIEGGCKFGGNSDLIFYLSDTGIGIPADKRDFIFERFAQINHGKNTIFGGTGLGLSIVKGLVDLMGGKIWLESELDKGTTFYFSIPYAKAQPVLTEQFVSFIQDDFKFERVKLLIVEDDLYNAEYLKVILSDYGFEIAHTVSGMEAIQIALNQDINLILMDIRLPDLDGYEALRLIRLQKPHLKVVAQTAYAANEDRIKALAAGFDDYISKPVKMEILLNTLSKQLKNN